MVPLSWYLILAAALFCVGMFGVLSRKNVIAVLMGIELMLNAVIINMVAFWRYRDPLQDLGGQVFAMIIFAVAAAEAAVGLALAISIYRRRQTVIADDIDELRH